MISFESFKMANVEHYFRKLYDGEKNCGRYIILEHSNTADEFKLTFIRFINQISKTDSKIVGFEVT